MLEDREDAVPPALLGTALSRRPWLILLFGLMGGVLAAGFLLVRPPTYTSSAEVLLRPIIGNPYSQQSSASSQQLTTALETEAALVSSPDVAREVSKDLGTQIDPGSSSVKASVVLNSQILEISYTASSPTEARYGASAFAEDFLAYRESQAISNQAYQLTPLLARQATLRKAFRTLDARIEGGTAPRGASTTLGLYATQLATIQQSIADVQSQATSPGSLVVPAGLPPGASVLRQVLVTGAGFGVGLLIGLVVAIWRTQKDQRIFTTDRSVAGVPIWSPEALRPAVLLDTTDERLVESYRLLRTAVTFKSDGPTTLAITSPWPGVGVPDVAVNLAVSLARADYRVSLVDASLDEGSTVADLLGVPSAPGVSEYLTDSRQLQPVFRHGVWVTTAGSRNEVNRELYSGRRFSLLLEELEKQYDFNVVVAPSLDSSEGLDVARVTDLVILAVPRRDAKREAVEALVDHARELGIHLAGIVLLDRRVRSRSRVSRRSPHPPPQTPVSQAPARGVDRYDPERPESVGSPHRDVS